MEEVQRRQHSDSQHYEGTLEVIGSGSRIATKRWVFERLGVFGNSKGMLRFTVPAEVKGVGLLIVNHPDRASDQWMWRPNIGREQRIALQDRSTRFFGTDFSFEDLEERDVEQFDYKLLGDEKDTWKLESQAAQVVAIHVRLLVDQERQLHHRQKSNPTTRRAWCASSTIAISS